MSVQVLSGRPPIAYHGAMAKKSRKKALSLKKPARQYKLEVRLSFEELQAIAECAAREDMGSSTWLRRVGIDAAKRKK